MQTQEKGLQVIGAGWGRTGTLSLKTALNLLGYKTYHMTEVFNHPWHAADWIAISDNQDVESHIRHVYEPYNFTATTDFPSSGEYKKVMQVYPHAKVILTIRDAEKWYHSCEQTIFLTMPDYPLTSLGARVVLGLVNFFVSIPEMFHKTMTKDAFRCEDNWHKPSILKAYEEHIEDVKKHVPAEQLLIINVTEKSDDKWQKLCQFLGKPIPSVPFPHVNDTAEFRWKLWLCGWAGTFLGIFGLGVPFLFSQKSMLLKNVQHDQEDSKKKM